MTQIEAGGTLGTSSVPRFDSDSKAAEEETVANTDIEMDVPPYPELRTVFLGGIFFIAVLFSLHAARDILIPVVLAIVLKLVLQPFQRFLENLRFPRTLAALTIVGCLIAGGAMLGSFLSTPATIWIEKLSDSMPQVQKRLSFLNDPMESAQKIMVKAENMTQVTDTKIMPVAVQGTRLYDRMFVSTRAFLSSLFTTILVLFFLLAAGDTFLRRLVQILPRFKDKRQAVDISQQTEHDISLYLLTITFMNAMVGILTGVAMAACGREDALLWGTMAFLLNYIPVIGPMIGFGLFLLVGLLTTQTVGDAMLPAFLYITIHVAESSFITPMLLAKRFTLNPVLVILSLVFWYWMWGIAGAILAMPMLAITKIVCDRIASLKPFGHFLEG